MRVGVQGHVPGDLAPGMKANTQFRGGWVGSRTSLDGFEKSLHHRDSIPVSSNPWRVAIQTTLLGSTYKI